MGVEDTKLGALEYGSWAAATGLALEAAEEVM